MSKKRKMIFRKIRGFKSEHLNNRLEFFNQYWTFLFTKGPRLIFEKSQFESHRTLLEKAKIQLRFNKYYAYKALNAYFYSHPYFQKNNPIGGSSNIQQFRREYAMELYGSIGLKPHPPKKEVFLKKIDKIENLFDKVESEILDSGLYFDKLASILIQILATDRELESQDEENLKFLINAFIAELFHAGYSLNYIQKIPDIICLIGDSRKFPLEKTFDDFKDLQLFNEYRSQELASINIKKMLAGINNLIHRKKKEGYYIFKVDGLRLEDDINILGVNFYNPQKRKYLYTKKPEYKEHDASVEFFKDVGNDSQCNVAVKGKFRNENVFSNNQQIKESKNIEYEIAYEKAVKALNFLNLLSREFGKTVSVLGKISKNDWFLASDDGDFKLKEYPHDLRNHPKQLKFKEKYLDWIQKDIQYWERLNSENLLAQNLLKVISHELSLENGGVDFSFKNLWIEWEGIFSNDVDNFILAAQKAVKIKTDVYFLLDVKKYLGRSFTLYYDKQKHFLSKTKLQKLGLTIGPAGKKISTIAFKRHYYKLKSELPLPIVKSFCKAIDLFLKNREKFNKRIDLWVKTCIEEVYIERNLEVHNNKSNELSKLKLREDFLFISNALSNCLLEIIDSKGKGNLTSVNNMIDDKWGELWT